MFNNKNYDEDYDSEFYYHKNKTPIINDDDYNNTNILQTYYDLQREISSICLLNPDIYEQIDEYEKNYKYLYDGSIRNYIKNKKFIIQKKIQLYEII